MHDFKINLSTVCMIFKRLGLYAYYYYYNTCIIINANINIYACSRSNLLSVFNHHFYFVIDQNYRKKRKY